MKKIIECVPNFSEGRNTDIIDAICEQIKSVTDVKLLNVDPGKATNRTVVTFAGEPENVIEAAFLAIKKASELIDMSKHYGEHPRMGATDVCPLIPVSGITMEETVQYSLQLAERVAKELNIPVYLYEESQVNKQRSNLSIIRSGEYEGFFKKISLPEWKPDFGPSIFPVKSGATVIGARDFLIAYNVNLNSKSVRIANRIAFDVREAGRVKRIGNPYSGPLELDDKGEPIRIPGTLKHVKAIGWYIEEYKVAQISMNLTNFRETPVHVVFDEVCKSAQERGVRVTGSELVGLLPLQALLDAGKYFLKKQGRSLGVSEKELIHIAVKSLGLDELGPFKPEERIIEYLLQSESEMKLVKLSLEDLANETASDSPAPGGGSISAACAALGISLGAMVANLSADKRGWEDKTEFFSNYASQAQIIKDKLLYLVDEDTRSFDAIMSAFGLPKDTEEEKNARIEAIESASVYATIIPLQTLEVAASAIPILIEMVENGNPNSLSDAGVGLACIQTALIGARMNVLINAKTLKDKELSLDFKLKANAIFDKAKQEIDNILDTINSKLEF
jgi:glutamate formiminotransferase / formiminotetrahydrofolate cyclodeaminase